MSCLGVHIALAEEQRNRLESLESDELRIDYIIEELYEDWDEEHFFETEKAWDAIHRCLTGQKPNTKESDPNAGTYPLKLCILGGRQILNDETNWIFRLIENKEVRDVAAALAPLDEVWLSERYWKHCEGAWPEYGEEDHEYTCVYFLALKEYFERMAMTDRSILFSADQ